VVLAKYAGYERCVLFHVSIIIPFDNYASRDIVKIYLSPEYHEKDNFRHGRHSIGVPDAAGHERPEFLANTKRPSGNKERRLQARNVREDNLLTSEQESEGLPRGVVRGLTAGLRRMRTESEQLPIGFR